MGVGGRTGGVFSLQEEDKGLKISELDSRINVIAFVSY
jgi:hypothetical protein